MRERMELYRGKRLWIERSTFPLPGGREKEAVVVHPGDAVVILPIVDDSVLLIRQWRFPIGDYLYEAPAGTMEVGEDPRETAYRELIEETGMAAADLIPRGYLYTTPGFTDERLWLFEARGLTPSDMYCMDDDEFIEPVSLPVQEVRRMIRSGELVDAKTICVFFRCFG